ncbi:hypothetical protein RJT34_26665 [Clitoria ternatea]|uniref:Uncharacterized protein n=1 Tax=Clitoria ternatea TaxID=43366 RepID=A0AAN9FBR6_CLITE
MMILGVSVSLPASQRGPFFLCIIVRSLFVHSPYLPLPSHSSPSHFQTPFLSLPLPLSPTGPRDSGSDL